MTDPSDRYLITTRDLPVYRSTERIVRAAKIVGWQRHLGGITVLLEVDGSTKSIQTSTDTLLRTGAPRAGDYLLVIEGVGTTWFPARVFEGFYRRSPDDDLGRLV